MGFEYSVSAIGAVIMQDAINLLGSTAVAAQTAGEKIRQMFTLPMESVGMAMATYAGQNHGAGRTDRIRQGIKAVSYTHLSVSSSGNSSSNSFCHTVSLPYWKPFCS